MKIKIENKKMMAVSLLLLLHGSGIIKKSMDMLKNPYTTTNLFGINNDIIIGLGFVIGSILLVDSAGLLFSNRIRIFYRLTKVISIAFMFYVSASIIYALIVYGFLIDFPVIIILLIFVVLYGAVFKYINLISE